MHASGLAFLLLASLASLATAQELPRTLDSAIVVAPFENLTDRRDQQADPANPRRRIDRFAESAREGVERRLVAASLPVVDRARLGSVLQEEALAESGLVDGASVTRVGAKVGAHWLVAGTLNALRMVRTKPGKREDAFEQSVVLTVRVIDITTMQVAYAKRYEGTQKGDGRPGRDILSGPLAAALEVMGRDAGLVAALRNRPSKLPALYAVVLPFANGTGVRGATSSRQGGDRFGETAREAVEAEFARRRVPMVDRLRLADAQRELALGETGLLDPASLAKVGKHLGARYVVTGSVSGYLATEDRKNHGVDLTAKVLVKVIDAESMRIVLSEEFQGDLRWNGVSSNDRLEAVLERALAKLSAPASLRLAEMPGN